MYQAALVIRLQNISTVSLCSEGGAVLGLYILSKDISFSHAVVASKVKALHVSSKTFTTLVWAIVTKLILCTSPAAGHIPEGGGHMYFVVVKAHEMFSYFTLFSTERSFCHVNRSLVCLYFSSQQPLQA